MRNRLLYIIIMLLIFQDWIYSKIKIISYLDEFICIMTMGYFLIHILKKKSIKLSKFEIYAIGCLVIYIFLGMFSSFSSAIIPIRLSVISLILTIKGYILYFGWRIIFQSQNSNKKILKKISKSLKYSIYIFAIIGISNIPLNFLKPRGVRFGITTVSIGFSHVTELAFFSIISMIIILFTNRIYEKEHHDYKIIMPAILLIILTGRSKAIAFSLLFLCVFYFSEIFKKIRISYIVSVIPITILIGIPRIKSELLDGARGELYEGAIKIANDFFPIGSGFGTYGSHISRINYSSLYYRYGLSNIWGLSPEMSSYITDTYWAMILGETGIVGLILIITILFFIFIQFIKIDANYKLKTLSILLIIYTIISSIAEPIYSSNKCAALFIILALFITYMRNEEIIN